MRTIPAVRNIAEVLRKSGHDATQEILLFCNEASNTLQQQKKHRKIKKSVFVFWLPRSVQSSMLVQSAVNWPDNYIS
jgi:hypothetical protein